MSMSRISLTWTASAATNGVTNSSSTEKCFLRSMSIVNAKQKKLTGRMQSLDFVSRRSARQGFTPMGEKRRDKLMLIGGLYRQRCKGHRNGQGDMIPNGMGR